MSFLGIEVHEETLALLFAKYTGVQQTFSVKRFANHAVSVKLLSSAIIM